MGKQLDLIDTFKFKLDIDKKKKEMIISDSDGIKKDYSLVCEIDATHSGTIINNRVYPPKSMRKGLKTWTNPYKKPVLTNHDDDKDPIGRVIKAKYEPTSLGIDSKEYTPILKRSDGYGYQRLTVKITDPSAIQKILDGRYETVSVRMSTNHAFCSICNSDWSVDGPCDHTPGQTYEKKLAYITTGDLSYRELSFVNIPADEFAGVKEAIITEEKDSKDPISVKFYANNAEEKFLSDLSSNEDVNLYSLLDEGIEEEDEVVLHLLDKSNKVKKSHKEEDVKLEELKKEQIQDLKVVKEMVDEAVAKSKSEYEKQLKKVKDECEKAAKDSAAEKDKLQTELTALKEKKDEEEEAGEAEGKKEEGEKKEEKEGTSEEINSLKDELKEKEEDRKRIMDENIKINSELHKMMAERLYDLKKVLSKPDVADVKTPDTRDKKVEEFAQRSIDSLKDQISDLLLEHEKLVATGVQRGDISNPGAAQIDKTNTVNDSEPKKKETKKDTLTRLFSKSK